MARTTFKVFIHGSANVPHDQWIADLLDAEYEFGILCGTATKLSTIHGDTIISTRADSYKCAERRDRSFNVVGGSNSDELITDRPMKSFFITNGKAHGNVDYYVGRHDIIGATNLGDSMAMFANLLYAVNMERVKHGLIPLGRWMMDQVLKAGSIGPVIKDGKYYGLRISEQKARWWAVKVGDPWPITYPT